MLSAEKQGPILARPWKEPKRRRGGGHPQNMHERRGRRNAESYAMRRPESQYPPSPDPMRQQLIGSNV